MQCPALQILCNTAFVLQYKYNRYYYYYFTSVGIYPRKFKNYYYYNYYFVIYIASRHRARKFTASCLVCRYAELQNASRSAAAS